MQRLMRMIWCRLAGHDWKNNVVANVNMHLFRCRRCGHERWHYARVRSVGSAR